MSTNTLRQGLAPLLAAAMLALVSCATTNGTGGDVAEDVTAIATPQGAVVVDTFTVTETVAVVDAAKRKVTLVSAGGQKTTYKVGPEAVNFGQIRVGDQVRATLTEEAAVFIGRGAPPSALVGAGVALAPVGAKPGGVIVDTMQETVKVTSVDETNRRVTILFRDGTSKTVKVGEKADLASVRPGDDVTVVLSEGLALAVEKP
jgi:hypothetical protein